MDWEIVDNVDKMVETDTNPIETRKNYPQRIVDNFQQFFVDNVDNFYLIKFSPIFTTSPAPMVINKSPLIHFSDKNFSISSKVEKW